MFGGFSVLFTFNSKVGIYNTYKKPFSTNIAHFIDKKKPLNEKKVVHRDYCNKRSV
jgi:hypothetical protein